jgi:hypothetical protein
MAKRAYRCRHCDQVGHSRRNCPRLGLDRCSVEGCGGRRYARGKCKRHYQIELERDGVARAARAIKEF